MSKWITHSEWAAFNQIMLYWNIMFFTISNVITSAENLFCSHEHHKGLQNPWNIWPPAYITPIPKKGEPTFSVPEQASYCLGFGCSCVVFLPDGLSTSARETIFDRTAPKRPEGDPEFTVKSRTVGGNLSHVRGMAAFRCVTAIERAHQNAALGR